MAMQQASITRAGSVTRAHRPSSLAGVLNLILDKAREMGVDWSRQSGRGEGTDGGGIPGRPEERLEGREGMVRPAREGEVGDDERG
jgi:hypothetical protein